MPVSSTTFVRTTILLLVVGFATVFAIIAASLWLATRTNSDVESLAAELRIRREVFRVTGLVSEAETGQRGYLLTQDPLYLAPYTAAADDLATELAKLRALVAPGSDLAAEVDRLAELVKDKLAELQETVDLVKAGRAGEALAMVRTDRGRIAMERVRNLAADLLDRSDVTVAARSHDLRSTAAGLGWFLAGGGFIILLVVGGTGWLAFRYTRDLELAQREVLALNATLEARVRERTADVARANSEIQRFAYIVSHDLRSPLVNIMGFTSEMEAGLGSIRALLPATAESDDREAAEARATVERDMPEAIGFIRSATNRMDGLINGILRLSREGERRLMPERVDMGKLFEGIADSLRHGLGERGGAIAIVAPMPEIVTDRLAAEQVFGNLLDNAVKYLDPARPGSLAVRARDTPMGIDFEVEDNGRGIAGEDHERIFDLFRRAGEQDRPGDGIGLSHVRALVRRLNGTITLRSEVGKGTTFRVRLPRILSVTQSE